MAHKTSHIVQRGGSFFYNRRVPERVARAFDSKVVRFNLGRDPDRATTLSEALTAKLDEIWASERVMPLDIGRLVESFERSTLDLMTCADDYLAGKNITERPVRLAVGALVHVAGNRAIDTYQRADARQVVSLLLEKGNKTATVRRRVQSLHAVLEYGYLEQDLEKRNPFARLTIKGENSDSKKRGVFSEEQLQDLYKACLTANKDTRLILPILGETGARLAEIVGMRWADVDLNERLVRIEPHNLRRLKTTGSQRQVPLVGSAYQAVLKLSESKADSQFVFPRWVRPSGVVATHASNTLNKYIRSRYGDLTCHCFRHTLRDRLRNTGCPAELVDQIGGWSGNRGVGASYGHGYNLDRQREVLERVALMPE